VAAPCANAYLAYSRPLLYSTSALVVQLPPQLKAPPPSCGRCWRVANMCCAGTPAPRLLELPPAALLVLLGPETWLAAAVVAPPLRAGRRALAGEQCCAGRQPAIPARRLEP
jgi:hypothetical protein